MFDMLTSPYTHPLKRLIWMRLKAGARAVWETITGNPVSFTAKAAPLRQLKVAFSPVQDLHGYANPWAGGAGVNLYDDSLATTGRLNASGDVVGSSTVFHSDYIAVEPSTKYYIRGFTGNSSATGICWYDSDKEFISSDGTSGSGAKNKTSTSPATAAYLRISVYASSLDPSTTKYVGVNYPSSETSYYPYENICPILGWDSLTVYHSGADTSDPQTISINFGQTVYGGTLDVLTGVVTVTHILNTYDGDEDWNISTSGTKHYFYVPTTENIRVLQTPISNLFKGRENRQYTDLADGEFAMTRAPAMGYFNIRYDAISTKADFTSMLSQTPMTIVCKLAEPLTIQLAPQEVSSLLGENNMWSDANGNLTVTYAADPATTPIVGKGKVGQAIIGG